MKQSILVFLLPFLPLFASGQFIFQNPSFEGTFPNPHVVPGPWDDCYGSPDTQPGSWGITLPPTDGSSYVSFLVGGDGSYREGASQQLNGCFTAGQSYTFTMDIAFSDVYNTAEPGDCYGSVAIWGGNSLCDDNELLWSSGQITTTGWNNVTVTFTPTQSWCFVTFAPIFLGPCSGYINGMVDNISPIVPSLPGLAITGPSENANIACDFTLTGTTDTLPTSVTLTGNFIGSPLAAGITGNNWQANIAYPNNLSGPQTIIATGVFPPNGDIIRDTLHINLIDFNADFTADTACQGRATHFTDLSTVTAPGTISNYLWEFEPGQTSTLQNPTYTYNTPGVHGVKLIITSNPGCTDTIVKQIFVKPGAITNFSWDAGCFALPVNFQDLSTPTGSITGWSWTFGDNTAGTSTQNPTHTYTSAGNYNVRLITNVANGCADTLDQQIIVDPKPNAIFTGQPVFGCAPLAVNFTDQSNGLMTSWAWDFGDNGSSIQQNPSHTFTNVGSYDVTLIITTPGNCADTLVLNEYIVVDPCVDLTIVDPLPTDTLGCIYTIVGTTNQPVQSVSISGSILNGPVTATLIDSTHWEAQVTMNADVNNIATLYATGNFGGSYTDTDTVTVTVNCNFGIPNVFTPNGDGINDYFDVVTGATTKYNMMIFNRWGLKIFTSTDQNVLWDGKTSGGSDCSDGVYYYLFTGEQGGKELKQHGTITLLRSK